MNSKQERTGGCGKTLRRFVIRGERPIELGYRDAAMIQLLANLSANSGAINTGICMTKFLLLSD